MKVVRKNSSIAMKYRPVYEAQQVPKNDKRVVETWKADFLASLPEDFMWEIGVRTGRLWYSDKEFKEQFQDATQENT